LSAQETEEAIEQHTSFLLTLKSDLEIAKQVLVKHKHDLSVVIAFIKDIKDIQEGGQQKLRVLKDVGCGVHMQAEIPDTSRVFVSVGLGFYAESTLSEAVTISAGKQEALSLRVEQSLQQVAGIEAHIQLISDGLEGLKQLTVT